VLADPVAASDAEPHRCELDDGPALALDTVRRLGCDGTIVGIVQGEDGEPLNIGRKTRSIPLSLKRALRARDGGCRFPGCDRTRFTEGHHVKHWADGGETKLSNLVSLCGFHHKLVHEGGFGVTVTDDGLFTFTRPDGRRIRECGRNPCTASERERFSGSASPEQRTPGGTLRMPSFEDALRFQIERLNTGIPINAQTSRCKWLGERMDYDMAIEGMQFRDGRAAAAAASM
jgi:HNH endonuclease